MKVFAVASNMISPLGMNTVAHWQAISNGKIGIKQHRDTTFTEQPFYASKLDAAQWQTIQAQTQASELLSPFEQLALYSAREALQQCDIDLSETAFILSTTKGNIEWLGQMPDDRLLLHKSAAIIAKQLGITHTPVTISHACASGVISLLHGLRLLQAGKYKHVIITGCDRFTRFVLKGFQSFQAVSDAPCKPFDKERKGITLGEAAATVVLSVDAQQPQLAQLLAGATSNDANHISGPSRTGEELALAIERALKGANCIANDIGLLSAHGTATLYNDEMEAKAFNISGLGNTPVHSLKGYLGHTLGTAGVLESAIMLEALQRQQLIPSAGYEHSGVSMPLNITTQMQSSPIRYALKTASGFGGCNAAVVWKVM